MIPPSPASANDVAQWCLGATIAGMTILLVLKLFVVLVFLLMFLRRPSLVWGIGLLTVTTAVLLDTFLGTFGRDEMQSEFGFFFPVMTGILFSGAAIWLWGVLRPYLTPAALPQPEPTPPTLEKPTLSAPKSTPAGTAFDRQMLYDQIRGRFGREDVLDLMFDLGINETEVITLNQDMNHLIINIMNLAEEREQTAALALAVERILTPTPPEHLPRLEKINVASPPTILRQYLLAHYTLADLAQMSTQLDIDWEQLGAGSKKEKVRELLLYLYRRNRVDGLITLMQPTE